LYQGRDFDVVGQEHELQGFPAGSTYQYELRLNKKGFKTSVKTGTFTIPDGLIYTEKRTLSENEHNFLGEFFFWVWGDTGGATLNLKLKSSLSSNTPNELKLYKSGIKGLLQTYKDVKDGDIITVPPFSSGSLIWTFDGEGTVSLEIIEGTAVRDGVNIPFDY
jgi:hypothetical protein